eukprot:m.87674 g.87674  ORF g.87674 m.87674 type:complete len:586 (-) comp13124_c0_seq2:71-1828(-)
MSDTEGGGKRARAQVESSSSSSEEDVLKKRRPAKKKAAIIEDEDSESNSGSGEEQGFVFKYGEDLIGDDEDRAMVEGLNELERELLMAERYEERQEAKERYEIMKSSKAEAKLEKAKPKPRRTRATRKPTQKDKKEDAMKKLKARRERDEKRKSAKFVNSDDEPEEEAKESSDDNESSYGESDEDRKAKKKERKRQSRRKRRDQGDDIVIDSNESDASDLARSEAESESASIEAEFEDAESIRLSRFKCERWCHEPFFDELVVGCFVRLGIGRGKGGKNVYRCCQIIGVELKSAYKLEGTRTRKALKLKHGTDEKVFRMETISNSPFEKHEFQTFCAELRDNTLPVPMKDLIKKKKKDIEEAKVYKHTPADVEFVLKEKRLCGIIAGHTGKRKDQIIFDLAAFKEAKDQCDDPTMQEEYQKKIDEKQKELDDTNRVALSRQRGVDTTTRNISLINKRNINSNFQIRKEKKQAENTSKFDAFARYARTMIVTMSDDEDDEKKEKKAEEQRKKMEEAKRREEEEKKKKLEEEEKKKAAALETPLRNTHKEIEVDIDLDLDIGPIDISLPSPKSKPVSASKGSHRLEL